MKSKLNANSYNLYMHTDIIQKERILCSYIADWQVHMQYLQKLASHSQLASHITA